MISSSCQTSSQCYGTETLRLAGAHAHRLFFKSVVQPNIQKEIWQPVEGFQLTLVQIEINITVIISDRNRKSEQRVQERINNNA